MTPEHKIKLLTFAAKSINGELKVIRGVPYLKQGVAMREWNPLMEEGDAFKLAEYQTLTMVRDGDRWLVGPFNYSVGYFYWSYAKTDLKMAITIAAAKLGGMP